ncbi:MULTISPECIES: hypothetical protein [unclassified Bradyrhizobium]|uniref:hypothetical protein n=1 Tax=unclassified Bradyrhizobium TaxID=2631580 RepID=UPI002915C92A|nr:MULTISPECIES: hypothetical protein [unclassified Bradyrhizobium]
MPDWVVPAAGLSGALLVAIANYLVQRWRYRLDRLSNSVDHFCQEINDVADLSSMYWLLDLSKPSDHSEANAQTIETQLVGRQVRLQSLILAIAAFDRRIILTRTEILLIDFFEAITGGDFKVSKRVASAERAQQAQSIAAQINGELRHAFSLRSRLWR